MSEYLNVAEAAEEIGVTTTSLYKLVNHSDQSKRLEPVNRQTHRGDGGFRFTREEIDRVKVLYKKDDLTSAEAAKRMGRSTTYIHKLINDNSIEFYEKEYRGKKTYFIKEVDLNHYLELNPDAGKTETLFDKRSGIFLYQPYSKEGNIARITRLKRINHRKVEAFLQTNDDRMITHDTAIKEGWQPVIQLKEKKTLTSYGYAKFIFPIPKTLDSVIYAVLEEFFIHAGPANMRISVEDKLVVEVRKSVLLGIMPATHPDLIDKLKLFIVEGEVIPKYDGVLIDTGLSPITFFLPEQQKYALNILAAKEGVSLQEWIAKKISLIEEIH
ncbi:helix-turn-helix domain-containing protein [Bacillus sp. FJAT-28004]|uniref:helix-turn-helix domain-containing protein n=1 Tax=Bacillus sp. FJAT-28004 TaxID=1679165 RepID=UPI0006B62D41|nr:helix-turn-helix domain-containing protein [Bacillus sp. FJAT-28004]